MSAGGSMTGGAFKNTSNLLGRRREIEELEEACKKALVQVESIQGDLTIQEGILAQEKKEKLEKLKRHPEAMAIRENTIRMNMAQLEEKKAEIAGSSVDLVRHGQLEEQVKGNHESQAALKQDPATWSR